MDHTALRGHLIYEEGLRLLPYTDTEGNLTVGVGHNLDKPISRRAAMVILEDDINDACADLDRHLPGWRLYPHQVGNAVASLCFQLGWPKLSGFVKMLAALKAGDWSTAAKEALDSRWAVQCPERAKRVAAMIASGE